MGTLDDAGDNGLARLRQIIAFAARPPARNAWSSATTTRTTA